MGLDSSFQPAPMLFSLFPRATYSLLKMFCSFRGGQMYRGYIISAIKRELNKILSQWFPPTPMSFRPTGTLPKVNQTYVLLVTNITGIYFDTARKLIGMIYLAFFIKNVTVDFVGGLACVFRCLFLMGGCCLQLMHSPRIAL